MKKSTLCFAWLIVALFTWSAKSHSQWVQTNGPYGGRINCFAVSGTNIFTGTGHGVFLSTNNGESWTAINNGLKFSFVLSFAISGTNIFAGTGGGGIFLSTNNGESWAAVNNGLTNKMVGAIAVIGTNIFAGTGGGGIFLSTNNGESWTAVNNGLTNANVAAIAVNGTNLFAGTSGGVFLSTNNGENWTAINNGLTNANVAAIAVNGTNLFTGTNGGGAFLSTDTGSNWTEINNGLTNANIKAFAIIGPYLFAGTFSGVFLSTDDGTNWTAVNTGLRGTLVSTLTVIGTNIFAGTDDIGVFFSANNGESWTAINAGLTSTLIRAFTVKGMNLFAGTLGDGIFLSTDNGANWTAVNNGLTNTNVAAFVVSGTNIFAGTTGGGVFLSTNDGASWAAVNNGLTKTVVTAFAVSGTNIFAGTNGGVFLSTNNGESWTAVNNGLTNANVVALAVMGTNLFAGTSGGGVFRSTDNGASWTAINAGLTGTYIKAFTVCGTNLFVSTSGGGVFLSMNNGESWTAVNTGLTNTFISSFAISNIDLFAGYSAVWRRPLSEMIPPDVPPASPSNLAALAGNGQVELEWNSNNEPDLIRYRIYGGTSPNPTSKIDSTTGGITSMKTITGLTNGTAYYFRITAVDNSGNESGLSNEASAIPSLSSAVCRWGFIGLNRIGGWSFVPGAVAGDAGMAGSPKPSSWVAMRGGFCTVTPTSTVGEAFVTTGKIEFVGGGFEAWSGLRFGVFYSESAGTIITDTTPENGDSTRWSGIEGNMYGYLFTPHSGLNADVSWTSSNIIGTYGGIVNRPWISTRGANDYVLGSDQQKPDSAVATAGTYNFGISVQPKGDGTQELRFYLVKDDNSYWFGGTVVDNHNPVTTTRFNGICFAHENNPTTTALMVHDVQAGFGDPITVPEAPSNLPEFAMDTQPGSQSINPGITTPYVISISSLIHYNTPVTLSVTGLPAGATASITPNTVIPSGTAVMTVETLPGTPVGSYQLILSGIGGTITKKDTVTLVIAEGPQSVDFGLLANPESQSVIQGATLSVEVDVLAMNGFSSPISFNVTGLPTSATGTFSPNASVPPNAIVSQLTITTVSSTPTGTYPLTVTGVSGAISRTVSVSLGILPPPPSGGNTPVSEESITVPVASDVSVGFASVSTAGTTSVTVSNQGPPPPSGFNLVEDYYEITTAAAFVSPVRVMILYADSPDEDTYRLFHMENGSWIDVTSPGYPDTIANVIGGIVATLSPFAIFVPNQPPVIAQITAPIDPIQAGSPIQASATFTDRCGIHTAVWHWGDDSTSTGAVSESNGYGTVSGSHTYRTAGVYSVRLVVTDDDLSSAEVVFQFVVVFNPDAGFVTGGGWINSPQGAYAHDPNLTGKANFGFVSKCKKGSNVPTGDTQFQFKTADLNFKSTGYEWLVIAGGKAKYKGSGTINNAGDYDFMLTATDGQWKNGTDPDRFRIKIWQKDAGAGVVYDNQMGAADDADAAMELGSGSIVVHSDAMAKSDNPDGSEETGLKAEIPKDFTLYQNYPNPFNPETRIRFALPEDRRVEIRIFTVHGKEIRLLAANDYKAGIHAVVWDGRDAQGNSVTSGIYLCRIKAGEYQAINKMVFCK